MLGDQFKMKGDQKLKSPLKGFGDLPDSGLKHPLATTDRPGQSTRENSLAQENFIILHERSDVRGVGCLQPGASPSLIL